MLKILHILLLFPLISCSLQNGSVKFVNKDGKVVYKTKQVPKFNQEYLNKHQNATQAAPKPIIINQNQAVDNNIVKFTQNNQELIKNSTAYQSKSVIDNNDKMNEVINKNLEIRNKVKEDQIKLENHEKTIEDFAYLPDNIFVDYIEKKEENKNIVSSDSSQNQTAKEDNKDITTTDKLENSKDNNQTKDDDGFFSFFKKTKSTEENKQNLVVEKDKAKEVFNNSNEVLKKEDLYKDSQINTKKTTEPQNKKDIIKTGNIDNTENITVENTEIIKNPNEVSFFDKIVNFFSFDKDNSTKKSEKEYEQNLNEEYIKAELTNNKDDVIIKDDKKQKEEKVIQINTQNNLKNRLEIGDIKTDENDIVSKKYKKKDTTIKKENIKNTTQNTKKVTTKKNNEINDGLKKGYYVQFGALLNKDNAVKLLNKYKNPKLDCQIITADLGERGIRHKVLCGPFNSKATADIEKERIINLGHYDVFIFKK